MSFHLSIKKLERIITYSCLFSCPLARDGTSKLPRNPGSLMGNGELADGEYSIVVSSE